MLDKSQQSTSNRTIIAAADMASADESTKMEKPTLFTLPREICDILYEYACEGAKVDIWCFKPFPDVLFLGHDSTANGNTGIITTTCKQIRAEAQKIYYQEMLFTFPSPSALELWVRLYAPFTMHRKIKPLRLLTTDARGLLYVIDERFKGLHLASYGAEEFESHRHEALSTLHEAREIVEGSFGVFKLSLEAIQVLVASDELEKIWTSKPDEIPSPTHDDLVEFDSKRQAKISE